jgi:thioredoxin-related protein
VSYNYGIQGYPTTFIMKPDGYYLGYIPGYLEPDKLDGLINEAVK